VNFYTPFLSEFLVSKLYVILFSIPFREPDFAPLLRELGNSKIPGKIFVDENCLKIF
jgi:hypothetical protein